MATKRNTQGAKGPAPDQAPELEDAHFAALAGFRRALRQVMADSESICAGLGMTTQRFQALLAIRAFPGQAMSVGDLAEELVLKHHSAVELAGRLEQAGLVARKGDPQDKRRVLLTLTALGAERLTDLARAHSLELGKTRDAMIRTLKTLPGAT
jgi:DNA-binding MarR family transcriptional regulator